MLVPATGQGMTYGQLLVKRADRNVRVLNECQSRIGQEKTLSRREYASAHSPGYRFRAFKRWQKRRIACKAIETDPIKAIYWVFGLYGWQAVEVADCESGGTFSVHASNGQYKGMFQMGKDERAKYGHGYTYILQARSAKRYFDASGQDWSPWECKP